MTMAVQPSTYLIGVTQPHWQGLERYLLDTDQYAFFNEMKIAVMEHGPLAMCSFYAKLCYNALVPGRNANTKRTRPIKDNIEACIKQGHGSVFEHVNLNFVTTNCSRVFSHQLVRHRVGTAYSQQSGHYCSVENLNAVVPPDVQPEPYISMIDAAKEIIEYQRVQLNLDSEPMAERKWWTSTLRRMMPDGASQEMGWSVNIRALRHIIELRTHPANEWEVRWVFNEVADMIMAEWPLILYGGEKYWDNNTPYWTALAC